jgi:glycosyltransferase involved in cell wall biosynthesis
VIPQAMAMGLPVVANAVDGSSEAVIPGETGYLCRPSALNEIAACCIDLLQNREKRVAMGKKGHEYALSEFDVRQMVTQIDGVYQELLSEF